MAIMSASFESGSAATTPTEEEGRAPPESAAVRLFNTTGGGHQAHHDLVVQEFPSKLAQQASISEGSGYQQATQPLGEGDVLVFQKPIFSKEVQQFVDTHPQERAVVDLREACGRCTELEKECDELRKQLQIPSQDSEKLVGELQRKLEENKKEKEDLKQQLQDSEKLVRELQRKMKEMKDLKICVSRLESEVEKLSLKGN